MPQLVPTLEIETGQQTSCAHSSDRHGVARVARPHDGVPASERQDILTPVTSQMKPRSKLRRRSQSPNATRCMIPFT